MFMGVYGFARIQAITYRVVCTRGQILGPRALCQVLAFWYIYQVVVGRVHEGIVYE